MAPNRFNVRVYGIWLHQGSLLVNEEQIRGQQIVKFPGGGLDPGEGTIDGLKREFREELGLDIEVGEHFYTTDFFVPSAYDNSQVISIYYLVRSADVPAEIINYVEGERTYWLPLRELSAETFSLPIDRKVGNMLMALYHTGQL